MTDQALECVKTELDLFSVPPTQTSIEEGVWDIVYPNPNFMTSPVLEFDIPGTNQTYIDMTQCYLNVTVKITPKNAQAGARPYMRQKAAGGYIDPMGPTFEGKACVAPVNNVLHSLFNQIQVYLNNTPVENTNDTYLYKAYLENLLCYGTESKNTFLRNEGWYKDTAGQFATNNKISDNVLKSAGAIEATGAITPLSTSNINFLTGVSLVSGGAGEPPKLANLSLTPKQIADSLNITITGTATTLTQLNGDNSIDDVINSKMNVGFCKRRAMFNDMGTANFSGRLHCDVFNTNRYLLNNVNIGLKMRRNDDVLIGAHRDDYTLNITDARMFIRRVNVASNVMLAHAMALEKATAKYPIKRVQVQILNCPFSASQMIMQGIRKGTMPSRVVLGFINQSTKAGKGNNPFYFEHMNIETIALKVSSKYMPYAQPIKCDFENGNYIEAYETLFKNIRQAGADITYDEFAKGYTLFAFDLSPDLCSSEHYSLLRDGSLDLEIKCSKTPSDDGGGSYYAVFYMEFDSIIEITKDRQVIFDFKV